MCIFTFSSEILVTLMDSTTPFTTRVEVDTDLDENPPDIFPPKLLLDELKDEKLPPMSCWKGSKPKGDMNG